MEPFQINEAAFRLPTADTPEGDDELSELFSQLNITSPVDNISQLVQRVNEMVAQLGANQPRWGFIADGDLSANIETYFEGDHMSESISVSRYPDVLNSFLM